MVGFSVKDKVALVTGGTAGIGFDFAKELLKNGVRGVTIASSNPERGSAALKELTEIFGVERIIYVKTDISIKDEFEAAMKKTVDAFKNFDILVNNAGIFNDKSYDRTIDINVKGTMYGCILGWEYLQKYRSGPEAVVLNLSSIAGLLSFRAFPVYGGTKFAIVAFTRNFGHEANYERTKVRFVAVCPGITWTPMVAGLTSDICLPGLEPYYDHDVSLWAIRGQNCKSTSELMLTVAEEAESASVWCVEGQKVTKVEYIDPIDVPEGFE